MTTALVSTSNLLFASKLSLMLRELGLDSVSLRANSSLTELLKKHEPVIIILDLGRDPLAGIGCVEELRSPAISYAGPILCFGPHVATDVMAAAESAGANLVVPNSVISVRGAKLISQLIQPPQ